MTKLRTPGGLLERGAMAEDTVIFGCSILFNLGVFVMLLETHSPTMESTLEIPRGYAYYEIVVPRKLARLPGKSQDQLSYIIKVEGKNYVVHLERKDPLVKKLPVFIYVNGERERAYHEIQGSCFFRGYVEGATLSFVTLNTCSGLRGLLQLENLTYNIRPMEDSLTFQHLISRAGEEEEEEEGETHSQGCWQSDLQMSPFMVGSAEGNISEELKTDSFLELFVQVDVHLFREHSENVSLTVHNVVSLIQMVDDMYFPLRLRVLLVGLEIWTEKNLIVVTDYVEETMMHFNTWRTENVLPRLKHRTGILLAQHSRGGSVAKYSSFGTVCDKEMAVAFVSVRNLLDQFFALAIAHELGHVIGIPDDPPELCYCASNLKCIMHTNGPLDEKPLFSNCSISSYFEVLGSESGQCLHAPPENVQLFSVSSCGNGVVEAGEECDCGDVPMCKVSRCCLGNCTMAPNAVCTKEPCCKGCRFAPQGTLCRKAAGECDLPEYCSGRMAECTPDLFVQDGTPCGKDGYCFFGTCTTHASQCKKIFGLQAEEAPYRCFRKVNSKGDRFGNCGSGSQNGTDTFWGCRDDDVLCGRVQCVNVRKLPELGDRVTLIQTPVGDTVCWGLGFPPGPPVLDTGAVGDGTKCGLGKVCLNHTCLNVSEIIVANRTCDPLTSCGGNGVCNSREHCHCRKGWDPPNCLFPGLGGSIDSGPVRRTRLYSPETLTIIIIASFILIIVVVSFPFVMFTRALAPSNAPGPQTMVEDTHLA